MKTFKEYVNEGSNEEAIKKEIAALTKEFPDAEVTFKKNKAGDTIVYVNGQTAYNKDDHHSFGSHDKIMSALQRAYKASKK